MILLVVFFKPIVVLENMKNNYENYGTYLMFSNDFQKYVSVSKESMSLESNILSDNTYVEVTSIIYFPGYNQLSFGFITNFEDNNFYPIDILDEDNLSIGEVVTYSNERYFIKKVEQVNCILLSELEKDTLYKLLVRDSTGEDIKIISFWYT